MLLLKHGLWPPAAFRSMEYSEEVRKVPNACPHCRKMTNKRFLVFPWGGFWVPSILAQEKLVEQSHQFAVSFKAKLKIAFYLYSYLQYA